MPLERIKRTDFKRKQVTVTPSFQLDDGTVGEMVYDGVETKFAVYYGGAWKSVPEVHPRDGAVWGRYLGLALSCG